MFKWWKFELDVLKCVEVRVISSIDGILLLMSFIFLLFGKESVIHESHIIIVIRKF